MRDRLFFPLSIVAIGIALRLIPHSPNVSPVTAIALFGGMYFDKRYAIILPLVIMFISDYFLGFHDMMGFVYASFLISGLLGLWIGRKKTASRMFGATFLASFSFFVITNLGVWLVSGMYSKTIQGLIDCFVMALPFFRNTVFGDIAYTTIFVLLFEAVQLLSKRRQPLLAKNR